MRLAPLFLFIAAPTAGCRKPEGQGGLALESGARTFAMRCAKCHGAEGAGDGVDTARFTPRPPNFQDPRWQAQVDDAWLIRIITEGGARVGRSAAMPPFADLRGDPRLHPLLSHLRSLGSRPAP